MSQGIERIRTTPVFNRNTLEGIIDKLSKTPSKRKPDIIREAQGYVLSSSAFAIAGISVLSEMSRSSVTAKELLEAFQPAEISDYLSRDGRIARKENFAALFQALNAGSGEEILIPMLFGYLSKPTKALTQAHKNEKPHIRINQEQRACLMANRVGLNLAEALYEFHDTDARRRLLQIVYKSIVLPELPVNTLVDFLLANASFAQPYEEAAKASAIVFALDTLFHLDIKKRIAREYGSDNSDALLIVAFGKEQSTLSLTIPLGKKPNLRKVVWGDPKQPHAHAWQQKTANMLQNIHAFTRRGIFNDLLLESTDGLPPLAIATIALRRILEREVAIEIERRGLESRVIPAPNDRTIYIAGSRYIIDDPPSIFGKVREKVFGYVRDEIFTNASGDIQLEELDTILQYLKPGEIDYEQVGRARIPVLTGEVQGGLTAVPQRGIINELTLFEEQYLRDMGLSEIAFFRTKEGTKVVTKWGGSTFSFFFDKNYKVSGLERLNEENRNFLTLVALSYLKALKNQDVEDVRYIDEPGEPRGEQEGDGIEKKKKRTISGRVPYLIVLAPGDVAHQVDYEVANADVQELWGLNLVDLNLLLAYIQDDRKQLENSGSEVSVFLNANPAGESIKMLLEKLLKRMTDKKSKPEWRTVLREDGTQKISLFFPNPPPGYEEGKTPFMVGYSPEIWRQGAKPRHTTCPGVASEIVREMYAMRDTA